MPARLTPRVNAAIVAIDARLPSDPADASDIAAATGALATGIAAVKVKTDALPAAPAAVADIPSAAQNADALLDRADGVETGLTLRQWLRLGGAVMFGKSSGLGTTAPVYRDYNDTKNRVSGTLDAPGSGNRTAVVRDAS